MMKLGLLDRAPLVLLTGLSLLLACPGDDTEPSDSTSAGDGTNGSGPASDTDQDGPGSSGPTPTSDGATSVATNDGTDTTSDGATTRVTGTETSDGTTTTGPGICGPRPIADLSSAIGIRFGDLPPVGGGGTSTTTGGGEIPDDNVSLRLANYVLTCKQPSGDGGCEAFTKWRLSFNVPVDMQQPGVYSFEDLNASWSVQDPGAGQDCPGTGGGGDPGMLIIESWGETIVGCIEAEESLFGVDPSGSFEADNCSG